MSESNISSIERQQTFQTITFMVILSLVCAIILSVLASALKNPQERAKELDRSKQMLIATQLLNSDGFFQIEQKPEQFIPAQAEKGGKLIPVDRPIIAASNQILEVYNARIKPFLVNDKGELISFEQAGLDERSYVADYRKTGYYLQPLKLIYKIYESPVGKKGEKEPPVEGYVIPVNGMGLWDAIYGYLAIKTDGNTVIGISWYDQKETPGLGANIADSPWQSQFPGKKIFQANSDGKTNFQQASLGIVVVKGKVQEVLGNSPKTKSAVDGMAGATLTGNGVTNAYKDVLAAYRPFLLQLHQEYAKEHQANGGKNGST